MSRRCHCRNWQPVTVQRGANNQIQDQTQVADQDQDQYLRTIFRNIGNGDVRVHVDNVSVAVAVLASIGVALGALAPEELQGLVGRLLDKG